MPDHAPAPANSFAPGYGAPPGPAPTGQVGNNGYAVAGLVFGLVGWFPLALLFGFVGLREVRRGNGRGRGFAVAGLVLGAIEAALTALVVIVVLV